MRAALVTLAVLAASLLNAGDEPSAPPAPVAPAEPSVTLKGEVNLYGLFNQRPRFSAPERHWLETSARLGAAFRRGRWSAGVTVIGVKTAGEDPFGTGTPPPGAPSGTPGVPTTAELDLDEAFVRAERPFGLPLTLTAGRQAIALGTQFLIGDGVYDGFARPEIERLKASRQKG